MTGIVGIKCKIMPSSPETNLEEIKEKANKFLEEQGANKIQISEEPVAFGLKAVQVFFQYSEEKGTEKIEQILKTIENVQSVQIIDIRKIA